MFKENTDLMMQNRVGCISLIMESKIYRKVIFLSLQNSNFECYKSIYCNA